MIEKRAKGQRKERKTGSDDQETPRGETAGRNKRGKRGGIGGKKKGEEGKEGDGTEARRLEGITEQGQERSHDSRAQGRGEELRTETPGMKSNGLRTIGIEVGSPEKDRNRKECTWRGWDRVNGEEGNCEKDSGIDTKSRMTPPLTPLWERIC